MATPTRLRLFRGTTELNYSELSITKTDDHIVNQADTKIEANSAVSASSVINVTKADGSTTVFSAKVDEKKEETLWRLKLLTNGYELMNLRVQQVYQNTSPEAIVQDVIDNNTSNLTYASTSSSSGVTVTKYIANAYAIDIIQDMIDLLEWQLRIDENDNVYFEPKGNVDNGKTFTNGSNIQITSWEEDKSDMFNHVKIKGGSVTRFTEETVTGTDTQFTLSHKPVDVVKVTISGSELQMTAPDAPYKVDSENKTVTFDSSRTDPTFDYSFHIPVVVEHQSDTSIATHGEIFKELQAPFIDNFSDARRYAKEQVSIHGIPAIKVKGEHPNLDFDREVGEIVTIADPVRDKSSVRLVIRKITYSAHENKTIYEFGTRDKTLMDQQREIQERIKKLERRVQDEDEVAFSRLFQHELKVSLDQEITGRFSCMGNSLTANHQTLGRTRADRTVEADCSDNGHHGTWSGTGVSSGNQFISNGFRLYAGSFNGSDRVVTVTDNADLDLSGDFTIALAVRVETLPGAETYLVQKWDGTDGWGVRINASNQVELIYSNGGADTVFAASTGLTAKAFQHVVFEKSGTDLTVYVNGSSDNTDTGQAAAGTNANDVEVGKQSTNYFDGYIDEVILYNAAIGSSRISDIFNKLAEQNLTNMKLWLSMDDPVAGDTTTSKVIWGDSAFIEDFADEDHKGSPVTASWDTTNKRLAMSSSSNHSTMYQTVAQSLNFSCGGRSFKTVTFNADVKKWNPNDQILFYFSPDGSNWEEVQLGQSKTLNTIDNGFYFRVVFVGNGGADTYISNLTMSYTLV